MENQIKIRRYEFDWLRVLAFSLLIFYHTGMYFVSWEWHVKNPVTSEMLQVPMIFMSQWRMSLIFLVSGVGVYFALGFRSAGTFAKDRLKRILLPLVIGMLLVVPPQVYFERMVQGTATDYLSFYPSVFEFEPYPQGNFSWHHLWYLAYIFCYSLLLLPLLVYLRRASVQAASIKGWMLLAVPALWLGMGGVLLNERFPATNALIDDWANHFLYITVFLIGFLLMKIPQLQEKVRQLRWYSLSLAGITLTVLYTFYWFKGRDLGEIELAFYYVLQQSNRWFWLMVILGFAMQHLNVKSKYLAQANEMVYPFYILHQTVIVALGYYLLQVDWSIGFKFTFISLGTFATCFLLIKYLIMPFNWLRLPFGMKLIRKKEAQQPVVLTTRKRKESEPVVSS
ncbi:acyltransferase family protein [Pontibacter amylolyticus]|uniref:Acyltransferase n=1 Tax=Pontibacter amylolyticus TaxID=1424080 RepID=A0ABQ1WG06_9BACT|nr:acyltransferase [Pontibacter amylolyticus]GGG28859.1 acyltransferase [Pontibacter amylolyticus]